MRRRAFGSLIATGMIVPPLAVFSQERIRRVGLLNIGTSTPQQPGIVTTWASGLLRGLAEGGFHQGRNLLLVERHAEGRADRLPSLATEIASARVEVVLAITSLAMRAMLAADQAVSVVAVTGDDVVASGAVATLARPGGRTTGINYRTIEGDVKRLELLRSTFPRSDRFGFLGYRPSAQIVVEVLQRAAQQMNISLVVQAVDGPSEYAAAFSAMKREQVGGVLVQATSAHANSIPPLVAAANGHGLPTICEWDFMARAGCVLGYGHDLDYARRRVSDYVTRILKGASPAELPVEQLDAWKLTINAGAASRLGITIPAAVFARAETVIE